MWGNGMREMFPRAEAIMSLLQVAELHVAVLLCRHQLPCNAERRGILPDASVVWERLRPNILNKYETISSEVLLLIEG